MLPIARLSKKTAKHSFDEADLNVLGEELHKASDELPGRGFAQKARFARTATLEDNVGMGLGDRT